MRILVTGGAGFIGSNFVHLLLAERDDSEIVNVDLLTYAGNLRSLETILDHPRHRFVRADIGDRGALERELDGHFDLVVNFAAESHVDRSIVDASAFVTTNVGGTQALLDLARAKGWSRFVQISTDEVYGSLGPDGSFTETTPIDPSSPYSASKAAADMLVLAAHRTHDMDIVVTRCSNNYGPYQFPEKLIPLMILSARDDRPLPVYGDGGNVRDWIHVEDHCRAVLAVAERGSAGRVYNIGASSERPNLEIVKEILRLTGKPESLIRFVTDRPGHDRRYAIDSTRMREELGWEPRRDLSEALEATVAWYLENDAWCEEVRSGEHQTFFERWYSGRLKDAPDGER